MPAAKAKAKATGQNGTGPTNGQKALAEATAFEESLREQADKIRDTAKYDGTLTSALLIKLRPLLTAPIPRHYIGHVKANSQSYKDRGGKEKKWPPHDMTGITGAQVQATRLSNVVGRQHWRVLKVYAKEGQLAHVFVIVGNGLANARITDGQLDPNGAEILISEDGYGGYAKGPEVASHYKGSETSAIKRVIARIGPGEEVYRQEADPELHPEDTEAPAPNAAPAVESIDAERVAELSTLAQTYAGEDSNRRRRTAMKLTELGAGGRSISARIANLTPGQADAFEAWLAGEQAGGDGK